MPQTRQPYGGIPNGAERFSAPGSLAPQVAPTALDAQVTSLLRQSIHDKIFGTTPDSYYASLQVLFFDGEPKLHPGMEYTHFEMPDNRMPIVIDNGVASAGTQLTAATAASPGAFVTVNVPVSQASYDAAGLNQTVHFDAPGWATIVAKIPGTPNQLTLRSLSGLGIPAIIQGAQLPMGAEIRADAEREIFNSSRSQLVSFTNFIVDVMKSRSYGHREWLNMQNGGTTDFLEKEWEDILNQFKFEIMLELWNGNKGFRQNSSGKYVRGTDGIKTQMLNRGVSPVPTSMGNFINTFEAMAFDTNYRGDDVTYVICKEEHHYNISKAYKEQNVRYKPDSMVANLNLNSVVIGTRTFVFVPAEVFGNNAYFPNWGGHVFLISKSSVEMQGQRGMPLLDVNGKMRKASMLNFRDTPKAGLDDIHTDVLEACFAPKLTNAQATGLIVING